MAQQVTQGGSTTTMVYVGDLEEVASSGSSTTTTAYYYAGGKRIGLSVNGTISYLAADALGSATETLNGSGSAVASQLFGPYGSVRYQNGTMPTSYGFTGQRADATSGLDYYGARYYDPVAGQFASGDSVLPGGGYDLWGLSRYAYVGGNPENRTDPTGHMNLANDPAGGCDPSDPSCGGGGGGGGGGGCAPPIRPAAATAAVATVAVATVAVATAVVATVVAVAVAVMARVVAVAAREAAETPAVREATDNQAARSRAPA